MINQIIKRIASTKDCHVFQTTGQPNLKAGLVLPSDVVDFYFLCGGLILFEKSLFPLKIVSPQEFESSNLIITGTALHNDRSDDWYAIAKSGNDQLVSIDLNQQRLGHYYDSFWDRHAIVGSCPILACSLGEFLLRSIETKGHSLYWLEKGFHPYGDAYD